MQVSYHTYKHKIHKKNSTIAKRKKTNWLLFIADCSLIYVLMTSQESNANLAKRGAKDKQVVNGG